MDARSSPPGRRMLSRRPGSANERRPREDQGEVRRTLTRDRAAACDVVTYRVDGHVAVVTLNRPERRNALNLAAYEPLELLLRFANADPEARVVVLTGADPAFCSGDDVLELMSGPDAQAHMPAGPVVRYPPTPAARVGPAEAAELLFTGDTIDSSEALRIGLVSEVVPHAERKPKARAMARKIAQNPPLAVRFMKEGLRRATFGDPCELGAWGIQTIHALMKTEDQREGVASFLERREPVFRGR